MIERKAAETARAWWAGLQPSFADGTRNPGGDRAALARLRRADLAGAMAEPATIALLRALGRGEGDFPRVALCAGVLAGIREDDPRVHPARALGAPSHGAPEQAAMKPIRFRRLIEADGDDDERLTLLRRAVQLAGRRIDVAEVAAACLDWSGLRQHWIYEYYDAGRASPGATAAASPANPPPNPPEDTAP